jgi:hypothetical protein
VPGRRAGQAAYLLIVKANQPTLHQQLSSLPWREVPIADHTCDRSHHRVELRRLQVTILACLDFPRATQAIRITRRVRRLADLLWRTVTVYAVTSLTAGSHGQPAQPRHRGYFLSGPPRPRYEQNLWSPASGSCGQDVHGSG